MNDHDYATCTAMEESDRACVRIFAMIYRNSKDEVREVMRRDKIWKDHAPKEEPCEEGYRPLLIGEVVTVGDEYYSAGDKEWIPTIAPGSIVDKFHLSSYRRPIAKDSELSQLRRWKGEQMLVEAQWSPQAVGKAMDLPLGHNVRPAILPWINEKKAEIEKLQAINAELLKFIESVSVERLLAFNTFRDRYGFNKSDIPHIATKILASAQPK